MACKISNLLHTFSIQSVHTTHSSKHPPATQLPAFPGRRQLLLLLSATTALKATELPSRAQDIPIFGLRKKLQKAEEEAEMIVKEGIESAEKGIEAAEKGIEAAEKKIETAEKELEKDVSFGGGFVQAGVVAGAELVGILVATSVVNGILEPEAQRS